MLIGLALVPRLGVQLHPSVHLPQVRISYSWHSNPAIHIEREVTSRLEAAFSMLQGVREINSVSTMGRGHIDIFFKKNTNIDLARFEIAAQIRRLYPSFPQGVTYPTTTVSRAAGRQNPLLTYTITAPETSYHIGRYVESQLMPALVNIKGVDNVRFYGDSPLEYHITYHTSRLEQYGIKLGQVAQALQDYFGENYLGIAYPQTPQAGSGMLPVLLKAQSLPNWQQIPVANIQGKIIYLGDVADISLQEQLPWSYHRINGQSTLMLSIYPERGENQIRLASHLRNQLETLSMHMPEQWQMLLSYDDTEFIRNDLKRVVNRMLFSLSILLLFVLLITRNYRYVLLILLTLLANILLAISWYVLFDVEIHLYSLAGITVSFGIIIDNSIVMIEHLRHHGNRKVFLAILAATLTTIGALSVIFMLNPVQQAQLKDFAAVVLINLILSLAIAWFLIPALQPALRSRQEKPFRRTKRRVARFGALYLSLLLWLRRYRWLVLSLLILGFGIPLHLLPGKLESTHWSARFYNASLGSSFYQSRIKPKAEPYLGGAFRLFSQFVFERSYFSDPERTSLHIRGQMPDGATIHQLNESFIMMEQFLAAFHEIDQYQTRILDYNNGMITVFFKAGHDHGAFPHTLKARVIQKALAIGGAEWSVFGVGQAFSNVLSGGGASAPIILEGYNYDLLYRFAEQLRAKALENPRINTATIGGAEPWRRANRIEFFLGIDARHLALYNLNMRRVSADLSDLMMQQNLQNVYHDNLPVPLKLISDRYQQFSVWELQNLPLHIGEVSQKTSSFLQLDKRFSGNDINKYNQQYRLSFAFNFMGPHILQERVTKELTEYINAHMPLGFKARQQTWGWDKEQKKDYLLILLVIVIIYFICAILLESLLQPLAIIGLIPISFIGLFLTFYLFKLNFDQGGLAAFILLSGLAVNAGLYILNDYNNFRQKWPRANPLRLYLKAYQYKILPVLLTISSTIIGLIPFLTGKQEAFWYAFAAGTIGGLVFSMVAIILVFPVFLRLQPHTLPGDN